MVKTKQSIEIYAWSLDLPESAATSLVSFLSDSEHVRARRFVKSADALHFIAARAGLRMILGEVLGENPGNVALETSSFGKPRLANHQTLHFNLSHSSGLAVMVFSRHGPVGIDVEQIRELASGIEAQFLSPREISCLAPFFGDHRRAILVRLWAAKEAVIKLHGDHRQLRPDDIHLRLDEGGGVILERLSGESDCHLSLLDAGPGFACVLAHAQPCRSHELSVKRWQGLRGG